MRRNLAVHLPGILVILGLVAVWEALFRLGIVTVTALPSPSHIGVGLAEVAMSPTFWVALFQTLLAGLIGLAIAVLLGVPLGIAIGRSRLLSTSTRLMTDFLRTVPTVAIIPVLVLLYGSTMQMKLAVIVYAAFWPVLIQTIHGAADTDRVLIDTSRVYRLRIVDRFRFALFPSALPYVLTGIRFAAVVALLLTLTAEIIGSAPGIGLQLSLAEMGGNYAQMYAYILISGLLGICIHILLLRVNARLLRWHASVRGQAS